MISYWFSSTLQSAFILNPDNLVLSCYITADVRESPLIIKIVEKYINSVAYEFIRLFA
jgi:hypothetical protein